MDRHRILGLVLLGACGAGGSSDTCAKSPLELGATETTTLGGFLQDFGIDFATGMHSSSGDIEIASNFDVGCRANAYVLAVGQVSSVSEVSFPAATDWARSANAITGEGLAVRAADGCPVAVHVVEHTDNGLSGGNSMTIEWARASCVPITFTVTPQPAPVGCSMNQMPTSSPTIVIDIEGYPPIERVELTPLRAPETYALSVPPGVRVTMRVVDRVASTPSTTTWSSGCTGNACTVCSDAGGVVDATVAWTPVCIPGA